jgi:DNA-binding NarL/FixJ family response regulator
MTAAGVVRPTLAPVPHGTLAEICRDLAARPYARRGVPAAEVPIRVMLVDDHLIMRSGLKALLRAWPDLSVVAEAAGGEEAVAVAERVHPAVAVMDLDMPHGDGSWATGALRARVPETSVLILTMYPERERLVMLLAQGARGYLTKEVADRDLAEAIRVVAAGEVYVRPAVARDLANSTEPLDPATVDARSRFGRLSERERSVVGLTAKGFNGPEIGRHLGITAKTVDTYKQRIEQKLGLSHRSEYVRFALDLQLLDGAP